MCLLLLNFNVERTMLPIPINFNVYYNRRYINMQIKPWKKVGTLKGVLAYLFSVEMLLVLILYALLSLIRVVWRYT